MLPFLINQHSYVGGGVDFHDWTPPPNLLPQILSVLLGFFLLIDFYNGINPQCQQQRMLILICHLRTLSLDRHIQWQEQQGQEAYNPNRGVWVLLPMSLMQQTTGGQKRNFMVWPLIDWACPTQTQCWPIHRTEIDRNHSCPIDEISQRVRLRAVGLFQRKA